MPSKHLLLKKDCDKNLILIGFDPLMMDNLKDQPLRKKKIKFGDS
jgi:hypothetical protein